MTLLIQYYNIPFDKTVTTALLNGMLPLGGIFGALITPKVVPLTSKRYIYICVELYIIGYGE
jgi:hypothetical protein